MLAAAVDRAGAGEGDVVEFAAGDQRLRDAVFGVGLGLGLEGGRIGQAEFLEGLGGFDDGAGVEMKVELGTERKRRGEEDALGHNEFSAACFLDGGDGFGERFGVERLAIADGAKIGKVERAVRNIRQRGFHVLGGGDVDGAGRLLP